MRLATALSSWIQDISWIPVDAAARAVTEMIICDHSPLHLLHPRPVAWNSMMEPLAKLLGLHVVPFDEWVERLEKSGEGLDANEEVAMMQKNPALKIIGTFIRAKSRQAGREALGLPQLDTTQAQKVAPSLVPEKLPPLSVDDAVRWIEFGRAMGSCK